MKNNGVTIVAVLKDEQMFVREWLAHHLSIGVREFILFDNSPGVPLLAAVSGFTDCVRVVPWLDEHKGLPGRNLQTKAYVHAMQWIRTPWVAYIDGDEFIVLNQWRTLDEMLETFDNVHAIGLYWKLFGHNGYYNDPLGLVTESLIRRRRHASTQFKSITLVEAISKVESVHSSILNHGCVQVNICKEPLIEGAQAPLREGAYINHYMCRSFRRWMSRARRGHTHYSVLDCPEHTRWHMSEDGCLQQFVKVVARDWNEVVDETLAKRADSIRAIMNARGSIPGNRKS